MMESNAMTKHTVRHSGRVVLNINNNWKFIKGDGDAFQRINLDEERWPTVNVPHTWTTEDAFSGLGCYLRGPFWYRKHIKVDSKYKEKQIFLQFDGVNRECDIYINGEFAGSHIGGYSIFQFDITSYIKYDEDNLIAVKVTNRHTEELTPIYSDSTSFGGILKDVYLVITDKLHVDVMDYGSSGVYITPSNVSNASADVEIAIRVRNDCIDNMEAVVNAHIVNAEGYVVKSVQGKLHIPAGETFVFRDRVTLENPRLWHGRKDPYLYRVYAEIEGQSGCCDVVSQPLGIRQFHVDADEGFFLNGEHYDLHGVARSYDRPEKGRAIGYEEQVEDMNLILEMGCTAVRAPLYDNAQVFYDLCDQYGILLSAEIPVTNNVGISEKYYETTKDQLVELIRQNYNHPCVVTWGLANEIQSKNKLKNYAPVPNPADVLNRLNAVAHHEDSTRFTNICSNNEGNTASNWIADLTTWNLYNGWYGDEHDGGMQTITRRLDKIRAANPDKKIGVSEYGPGASIHYHSATPRQRDHTEEYQCLFHETYWNLFKQRKFLWVKYAWLLCDFSCDRRNEGDTPGINDKGMITFDRKIKKDVFYWYKANWSKEPFVYITSRRFSPRPKNANKIKIYSNCESVEMILNGVSLGVVNSSDKIFEWENVDFVNGINILEAVGVSNGLRYSDRVFIEVVEEE